MRAVDATLAGLKRAGVDAIFGLPGGPLIPLFDALHDDPDIRLYLVRHEQGAGHMAEGYAKVTGRVGVRWWKTARAVSKSGSATSV